MKAPADVHLKGALALKMGRFQGTSGMRALLAVPLTVTRNSKTCPLSQTGLHQAVNLQQ